MYSQLTSVGSSSLKDRLSWPANPWETEQRGTSGNFVFARTEGVYVFSEGTMESHHLISLMRDLPRVMEVNVKSALGARALSRKNFGPSGQIRERSAAKIGGPFVEVP